MFCVFFRLIALFSHSDPSVLPFNPCLHIEQFAASKAQNQYQSHTCNFIQVINSCLEI